MIPGVQQLQFVVLSIAAFDNLKVVLVLLISPNDSKTIGYSSDGSSQPQCNRSAAFKLKSRTRSCYHLKYTHMIDLKELAFRYDLFIAPDWRDRFDTLINENIQLPSEGEILDVNCGTGAHAIELAENLRDKG